MSETVQTQAIVKSWRRVIALLTACVVTLLGIWRGLDPEVILLRALGAALLLGMLFSVAASLFSSFFRSSR